MTIIKNDFEGQSLFKNQVKLSPKNGHTFSQFKDYRLIETNDDDWVDVDNANRSHPQDAYLQNYAAGEHLAHRLAYDNLIEKPLQQVLESDGSVATYESHRIQTNHAGLVGYILVPTQTREGQVPDIKVIFRGTKPSSLSSLSRNIEEGGAGATSFSENRDLILKQINGITETFKQPVTLTVAGHSLGGADAQNCTAAIIDAISQNQGIHYAAGNKTQRPIPVDCRDHLHQLKKLKLFTYNAAGIPQAIAERSKSQTALLAEKRAKGEYIPEIECYNQHVGGDGVQQTGEAHLLSDVPKHHAKVDVLKAHLGSEAHHVLGFNETLGLGAAAIVTAGVAPVLAVATAVTGATVVGTSTVLGMLDTQNSHCQFIHAAPREDEYESFSNASPEGQAQVHAELNRKSGWLNTIHKGSTALYKGLQSLGEGVAMTMGYSNFQRQAAASSAIPATEAPTPQSRPWYRAFF